MLVLYGERILVELYCNVPNYIGAGEMGRSQFREFN